MVSEDGDLRWLRFHTVAVEWDGRLAALSFAADVTTLKQAEEKQQRLMKEIEHLAYVVSHDLRAPLINLRGFLKLLESGLEDIRPVMESAFASLSSVDRKAVDRTLSEDVPEALHYMGSSLTHMNRLIDAILRLSRLGRTVLEPVPVSVREIVDQVLDTLGHDILELGIAVAVGDLPDVTADRTALEQIFSNLIGNAVKFRDPLRPLAITIAGYRLTGETAFVVKDTGRGVKAEDLSRIFEVFERSGDRDVPGEGMGLSYVRTLVSKHGGRIWCESTPGEGSTFTFTIARRIDAADE
jgi:signal transduction histidine kinase